MGKTSKKYQNKSTPRTNIPVQEFVNTFTDSFTSLLTELLAGCAVHKEANQFFLPHNSKSIPEGDYINYTPAFNNIGKPAKIPCVLITLSEA